MAQLAFTEFFCGIGGLSACLPDAGPSVAIDINQNALKVYQLNYSHQTVCKTIESLTADEVAKWPNELWWMSPPCQPYTRRGLGRDLDDPRSVGLLRVVDLIGELRPSRIGLENVPEFLGSDGHGKLLATFDQQGYHARQIVLCPTQLGSFNRRKRYYLIASRDPLPDWAPLCKSAIPLLLQDDINVSDWQVPPDWLTKYASAVDIVDGDDLRMGRAATACFTSAYGRSPVRSGSYLKTETGTRFFTPAEILWQLGFAESFRLPDWQPSRLWPLAGNTLALPAVHYVLEHLASTSAAARQNRRQ